ncbi:hypothetical protein CRG98_007484 [Punica granatum]|uniref:Reverse transcriptase Ty1/copia-type domain-containing protein n=1 Tax=Punica granatum TaxID=22663 RepID=A0A2I0KUD9_PUNGR|nr:hypothetical protein CRG98_007484 [Punica granatum]
MEIGCIDEEVTRALMKMECWYSIVGLIFLKKRRQVGMGKKPRESCGLRRLRLVMDEPWAPRSLREVRDKVRVLIDSVFEIRDSNERRIVNGALSPTQGDCRWIVIKPVRMLGMSYPIERFIDYSNISNQHKAFLAAIDSDREPTSYQEVVRDRRWRDAMAKEIRALKLNKTWTIEQLPPGKHLFGYKWVYKVKLKADGSVERYKARLVAKGFTQVKGTDYHEALAQVAKLVTV